MLANSPRALSCVYVCVRAREYLHLHLCLCCIVSIRYLRLAARRIAEAQRVCFDVGLNMYVETHIQRVSEDPGAFVEIMVRW